MNPRLSGDAEVFDYNEEFGITEYFDYDEATGRFQIVTMQDAEPILERNKARFNTFDERSNWKGDFHWVGDIPLVILEDLNKRGIGDNEDRANGFPKLRKWLNGDGKAWKVRPGRV